ncbi:unnamed protein product [Linum trigynum]|uniref:Uncharacterized protein n=1 Tax=Linum trigynum TaxID=586398 RepID=A0AAV2FV67_9ROSI
MKEMFINVEYCGLSKCCVHCGVFGHDCSLPLSGAHTKKVWRKKTPLIVSIEPAMVSTSQISEATQVLQAALKGKAIVESQEITPAPATSQEIPASPAPVTPSTLPSQEEFNKVINGVKSRSTKKSSIPILHSNAFDVLCGSRDICLQAPPPKKTGREGLRKRGEATKVATLHK